jgi:hypothetical protein
MVNALYVKRLLSNEIAETCIALSTTKPGYGRLELDQRRRSRENWRDGRILGYTCSIDYIQI